MPICYKNQVFHNMESRTYDRISTQLDQKLINCVWDNVVEPQTHHMILYKLILFDLITNDEKLAPTNQT